jgi:hypothetical protein
MHTDEMVKAIMLPGREILLEEARRKLDAVYPIIRAEVLAEVVAALDKESGMGFGDPDEPHWYAARFVERMRS